MLETIGIVALLRALWEEGGLPAGYVPLRALASGYGMVLRFAQCRFATMFRSVDEFSQPPSYSSSSRNMGMRSFLHLCDFKQNYSKLRLFIIGSNHSFVVSKFPLICILQFRGNFLFT